MDDDQLSEIRSRYLGFIFQSYNLLAQYTVVENIEVPLIYQGTHLTDETREHCIRLAGMVGLGDRLDHRPMQLSGGQQQRVAIARSLVNDPHVILADEPTGNLDSRTSDEIMIMLQKLNKAGKTIIMVTHENDIAAWARRVVRMRDGHIESDERNETPVTQSSHDPAAGRPARSGRQRLMLEFRLQAVPATDATGNNDFLKDTKTCAGCFLSPGGTNSRRTTSLAIRSLWLHKLRAVLSVLGIIIGTAAVISLMAFGEGSMQDALDDIARQGATNIIINSVKPADETAVVQTGLVAQLRPDQAGLRHPALPDQVRDPRSADAHVPAGGSLPRPGHQGPDRRHDHAVRRGEPVHHGRGPFPGRRG